MKRFFWVQLQQKLICRFACKEITLKGHRGWRLKVVEAFIIILTLTELLYLLLIHAGMMSSRYGPGYRDNRDTGYGTGGHGTDPAGHTGHKGTGIPESRVWLSFQEYALFSSIFCGFYALIRVFFLLITAFEVFLDLDYSLGVCKKRWEDSCVCRVMYFEDVLCASNM